METSNFKIKQDCLTNGYIKEQLINKKADNLYPLELSRIISDFLGNILLKFDFVEREEWMKYIHENGRIIDIPSDIVQSYFHKYNKHNFGCSLAIDKGVTFIDIQCINPGRFDVIGIVSDFDECKRRVWFSNLNGYKYWWYNGSGIFKHHNSEQFNTKELKKKYGEKMILLQ